MKSFVLTIVVILVMSFFFTKGNSTPISPIQLQAVEFSDFIYSRPQDGVSIAGVGQVNLYKDAAEVGYLVFRGTSKGSLSEILLNFSLVYTLSVLFLAALFTYAYRLAGIWKAYFFVLVLLVAQFFISHKSFQDDGNYRRSSAALLEKLYRKEGVSSLSDLLRKYNLTRVVFAGHSKGGAEATIAFTMHSGELKKISIETQLVTVGAPAVTEAVPAGSDTFRIRFQSDTVRWLNFNSPQDDVFVVATADVFLFFKAIILMVFAGFISWGARWILEIVQLRYHFALPNFVSTLALVIFVVFCLFIVFFGLSHPAADYLFYFERDVSFLKK